MHDTWPSLFHLAPTVRVERKEVGEEVLEEAVADAPDRQGRDGHEARAGRIEVADREVARGLEGGRCCWCWC